MFRYHDGWFAFHDLILALTAELEAMFTINCKSVKIFPILDICY